MPRDFLFGTVRVPMWDYRWGLTAAQVEILTIDQPMVAYKRDEDKETPWKNGKVSESYAKSQYQKWLEKKKKREKEGKTLDAEKVFGKGKRIDFGHLLKTGEERPL